MKKVLLAMLIPLLLASCSSYYTIAPYGKAGILLDYGKYAKNGIFITESTTVPFDYTPIGSISILVRNGEDRTKDKIKNLYQKTTYTDFQGDKHTTRDADYPITSFNIYDVMDVMADSIKSAGGDGIMNFDYTFVKREATQKGSQITVYLDGCLITGMVFKRK